eukprot:TRINITY_DN4834_c0_g2_i1.p1 TRINITY_DN4834_c0_g2~~TRINITY_DN4834_c0_g2_i1.p1  ORF type:complete len:142 (+),score=27.94 TRINITY_DN4834_c0_g2_i1:140-565(+)
MGCGASARKNGDTTTTAIMHTSLRDFGESSSTLLTGCVQEKDCKSAVLQVVPGHAKNASPERGVLPGAILDDEDEDKKQSTLQHDSELNKGDQNESNATSADPAHDSVDSVGNDLVFTGPARGRSYRNNRSDQSLISELIE